MMHFASVGALGPNNGVDAYGAFLRFLLATGGSAVGFFFVLSGFILAHAYHQRLNQPAPRQRRQFWRARFARIYPTYLLALCLTTFTALALGYQGVSPWKDCTLASCSGAWLLSFIPLQAWFADSQIQQLWNAPGWSVATEAFFYVLFPWLLHPAIALAQRFGWWTLFGLWVIQNLMFTVLSLYTQQASPELQASLTWWHERLPLLRLPEFLMGICAWTLAHHRPPGQAMYSTRIFTLIAILTSIWYLPQPDTASLLHIPLSGKAYLLAAPCFALLIYWLACAEGQPQQRPTRWLNNPILITLGKASYSLYILHWCGLQSLFIIAGSSPPAWTGYVTVLLLIGGSVLVHRKFERPMQQKLLDTYV